MSSQSCILPTPDIFPTGTRYLTVILERAGQNSQNLNRKYFYLRWKTNTRGRFDLSIILLAGSSYFSLIGSGMVSSLIKKIYHYDGHRLCPGWILLRGKRAGNVWVQA